MFSGQKQSETSLEYSQNDPAKPPTTPHHLCPWQGEGRRVWAPLQGGRARPERTPKGALGVPPPHHPPPPVSCRGGEPDPSAPKRVRSVSLPPNLAESFLRGTPPRRFQEALVYVHERNAFYFQQTWVPTSGWSGHGLTPWSGYRQYLYV